MRTARFAGGVAVAAEIIVWLARGSAGRPRVGRREGAVAAGSYGSGRGRSNARR
ncbi:hypothetical protein MOX02_29240 [Methylobacterium oxalidis]|uniref:Uncharacterized protein n=1 Tax=Methylobacterium oxalidis TaxID=944322 RepID=A0A512J4I5_9HYPH|nr:hypothetical protein MOX02_29240 [Methylobacterium oxalidis]GLS67017.1 hypothetical protein GCM10007888_54000 [Methylobacterium oxalidis]